MTANTPASRKAKGRRLQQAVRIPGVAAAVAGSACHACHLTGGDRP